MPSFSHSEAFCKTVLHPQSPSVRRTDRDAEKHKTLLLFIVPCPPDMEPPADLMRLSARYNDHTVIIPFPALLFQSQNEERGQTSMLFSRMRKHIRTFAQQLCRLGALSKRQPQGTAPARRQAGTDTRRPGAGTHRLSGRRSFWPVPEHTGCLSEASFPYVPAVSGRKGRRTDDAFRHGPAYLCLPAAWPGPFPGAADVLQRCLRTVLIPGRFFQIRSYFTTFIFTFPSAKKEIPSTAGSVYKRAVSTCSPSFTKASTLY